ncbi:MaoC family dehydratase [Pseudorhodoplanes sp.]|uniref:MaoC family dehydratase n=1 Tax=Pseudorhodoplanes sp. TaxID=1934341 RepID=UPI00391B8520
MNDPALTGSHNYFEDFTPGLVIRHSRGKTVENLENVFITNLVMNTADGHFNEHLMSGTPFGTRIVFGGVTASIVIGLAAQDTAENALAELSITGLRLKHPVVHGDTLYAFSEVLGTEEAERPDAGIVRFRHTGLNQDDRIVFEAERRVLIRKRPLSTRHGRA